MYDNHSNSKRWRSIDTNGIGYVYKTHVNKLDIYVIDCAAILRNIKRGNHAPLNFYKFFLIRLFHSSLRRNYFVCLIVFVYQSQSSNCLRARDLLTLFSKICKYFDVRRHEHIINYGDDNDAMNKEHNSLRRIIPNIRTNKMNVLTYVHR